MLWGGQRVPFTLLGGYLGAGKTTILNHVLRHAGGRRIVVLVNDVGAVNVDAALIADHDGQTLTLTNGCVCCAIADDFADTLEQVRALPDRPDHVVMELSGVGEPARIAPWANTTGFRLDGIVVAADADQVVELAGRRYVGDTVGEQLSAADLVVLTKTDVADDGGAAARAFVAAHTAAPVIDVVDGAVDIDVVLGLARTGAMPVGRVDVDPVGGPRYETTVVDVGVPTLDELRRALDDLPADTIRAKGLVGCTDQAHPVEAHVVGARRSVMVRPDLDGAATEQRLVVIAQPS